MSNERLSVLLHLLSLLKNITANHQCTALTENIIERKLEGSMHSIQVNKWHLLALLDITDITDHLCPDK